MCFRKNFVLRDAFSCNTLFVSIRGGLWTLTSGSVKQLAPFLAAFDRPHCQKRIPQHFRECFVFQQWTWIALKVVCLCVALITASYMRSG